MIPYLINDISVQVPSSWDDITFNQWSEVAKLTTNDRIKLVSIVLNMDEAGLRKAKLENVEELYRTLEFIHEPCEITDQPIKIKDWTIPKDITFECLAQFEDMRKTFDEAITKIVLTEDGKIDQLKTIPAIAEYFPTWCAIYCQKLKDGEYDYEKATYMIDEIKEAPCVEVISVGSFFFYRLMLSSFPIRKTSLTLPQQ